MSEEQFDYKCKNGHEFKSKAAIRALCPICGESTKRTRQAIVQDDKTVSITSSGDDKTDGNAETKGNEEEQSTQPEKKEESRKEPARTKVIRVKRKEKDEEVPKGKTKGKTETEKPDDSRQRLIKRRGIRQKFAHPRVQGKLK